MRAIAMLALALTLPLLSACSPEVGSKAWCEKMDKVPKGEWTANDVAAYAKSCVLGMREHK